MFRKRECCLHGDKVLLVPYSPHHVERYHEWMQNPTLRAQTASDPLTVEQEYEMQLSWMRDVDKCTFIVLDKELCAQGRKEVDCMVGDVNMFLSREESADAEGDTTVAEIDIMIAELSCRGRGYGIEATVLMMTYGAYELGVGKFRAKVGMENKASFNLFQNKLKFKELSRSDIFKEITLELVMEHLPECQKKFRELKWTKYVPETQSNVT